MGKPRNAISPTREEDYPEWYQQVVKAADLAENTPVRGCMVIKPWGYGIWENIRDALDTMFKSSGHKNASTSAVFISTPNLSLTDLAISRHEDSRRLAKVIEEKTSGN